jgi:hypothetical protein
LKKYLFLIIIAVLWGCIANKIDDIDTTPDDDSFVGQVPANFSWSAIVQKEINVTFKVGNLKSNALDNTLIELYNENNELLDALTIIDGIANFNVRIPTAETKLKLMAVAANMIKEINTEQNNIEFQIPNVSAINFAKVDTDKDGLFDPFDSAPFNADLSIRVNNGGNGFALKSANVANKANYSYVIFEDLWPSKGDYDFNDMVVKATYSWERGKSNYIQEIKGVIEVEWIGAGMGIGLGYELLGANGVNLEYLNNVIIQTDGSATTDKSVTNGIIVFNKVQEVGVGTLGFSMTIKDKEIKDFVCVPYLFRTNNPQHQVRPFGAPPTQNQDMTKFKTYDDASPSKWTWEPGNKFIYPLKGANAFYRSKENYPWGIEFIAKSFKPSNEKVSITKNYTKFKTWAESGGEKEKDWYDYPNE